jgi:hypothetical protein
MNRGRPRNHTVDQSRLDTLRIRKTTAKVTNSRIAEAIGGVYSPSMISTILRGDCGCPPEILSQIEKVIAKAEKVKAYEKKIGA